MTMIINILQTPDPGNNIRKLINRVLNIQSFAFLFFFFFYSRMNKYAEFPANCLNKFRAYLFRRLFCRVFPERARGKFHRLASETGRTRDTFNAKNLHLYESVILRNLYTIFEKKNTTELKTRICFFDSAKRSNHSGREPGDKSAKYS